MKRKIRTIKFIPLLVAIVLLAAGTAHAQEAITVTANNHEHVFRQSMTFRLEATSSAKIDSVKLFYRVSGQTSANKVDLEFDPAKTVSVEHTEDMADEKNYQPPMVEFTYWWIITDESGNRLKTGQTSFVYEDTNYTWQVLSDDLIRLYWHDQDDAFGQHFFNLATETAAALRDEFGVVTPRPAQIVIYNSHEELMAVLQEASSEWTGAVTFGETGCIAIGLGSMDWMDRVVPHELTHATLYMITKPPFGDIPRWLHEGLAMRSEGGMSGEERAALADAIKNDTIISLRVLNSAFPDARERAILSYAESNSLIMFIIDAYGTAKLGELVSVFAQGAHYDDAMREVFGVDMDGIEDLWREHIGAPPRQGHTRATPAPSPTATSTSIATPTVEPSPTKESATPLPTATSAAVEATASPTVQPTPTLPPPTPAPERSGPCLGAGAGIALLALFIIFRARSVDT